MKRSAVCAVVVGMGLIASCVGDDPVGSTPVPSEAGVVDPLDASADRREEPVTPDGGPVVTDIRIAGSRLEPTYFLLDDGTRYFDTWYDKELNSPCSFQVQADGTFACVPTSVLASTFGYATSGCDQNLAAWLQQGCSKVPSFVSTDQGNGCFADVYGTGAILDVTYESGQDGVCRPLASQGGLRFERGAKIDASTFVQARLVEWAEAPTAASRTIRAQFLLGSDGSYGFGRWVLATADTACDLGTQPYDATTRCYPKAAATPLGGYFSDSSCATLLLFEAESNPEQACTGALPRIAAAKRIGTCGEVTQIDWATAGAVGDYPYYYRDGSGVCTPGASPTRGRLQGAPLPIEAFGSAVEAAPDPRAGVTPIFVTLPDGTRAQRGYYDGVRQTECTFGRAPDLSLRCLPVTSAYVERVFEDAACAVPAFVTRVTSIEKLQRDHALEDCLANGGLDCVSDAGLTCAPPPKPRFALSGGGVACTLDTFVSAWEVGDAVASYWSPPKSGPGCVEHVVSTGEAVFRVREIPAADLFYATAGTTAP